MDILIKNINSPKAEDWISLRIDADGKVVNYDGENATWVELPPHGRCIDADFFEKYAIRVNINGKEYVPADYIKIVPTVLEAST